MEKPKKGQHAAVKIESVSNGGEAVARLSDFVIFIPFGAVGDIAEIEIETVKQNYAVGKIVSITTPSPSRISPPCPHFGVCGGCSLQHISYQGQLDIKKQIVTDAMERIGKIPFKGDFSVLPSDPYGYRNKVQFVCQGGKIGLYEKSSHRLKELEECMLQTPLSNKIVSAASKIIKKSRYLDTKSLRHLAVRTSSSKKEALVTVVCQKENVRGIKQFAEELCKAAKEIKGVSLNINPEKTNVIYGSQNMQIVGSEFIEEKLLGKEFRMSCDSFFQVNHRGAGIMAELVRKYLPEDHEADFLDAYCGSGFFSVFAADKFRKVYGIEEYEKSIDEAIQTAKINSIENCQFIKGRVEDILGDLNITGIKAAVIDPPRKGADIAVIERIAAADIKNVIYVSCNPATLARDLSLFAEKGYEVQQLQPVDMFAQTPHVETVCLLSKLHNDHHIE